MKAINTVLTAWLVVIWVTLAIALVGGHTASWAKVMGALARATAQVAQGG